MPGETPSCALAAAVGGCLGSRICVAEDGTWGLGPLAYVRVLTPVVEHWPPGDGKDCGHREVG